jgi:hypothetical protein
MTRALTPQEKKRLSLAKDCRNDYRENDKASRKNIPRRRAAKHRKFRRTLRQVVASHANNAAPDADALQIAIKEVRPDIWQKTSDVPLGEMLNRRGECRSRTGWPHRTPAK